MSPATRRNPELPPRPPPPPRPATPTRLESPLDAIALDMQVAPHEFSRRGWRWWICDHCFAPRSLHPREGWTVARPSGNNGYLSANAPHFEEGW